MIPQGFNPEMGDLATFVEHCKNSEDTDNIAMAKVSALDEDIDTTKNSKCSKKTKGRKDSGKKRRKNYSLYCSLHWEKNSHTSSECKALKARAAEKYKSKYENKDYKKNFKELNLLQAEAANQKSNNEKLNKSFTKRNTYKEDTVNLVDSSDSNSSSRSEYNNYFPKSGKKSHIIRILMTMSKLAAVPLEARTTIDSTVAEMHLSYINQK